MIIREYRIVMPLSLEEYKLAQLWSNIKASKEETSGGEGIEFVLNEPRDGGQYTRKIFYLSKKVPNIISSLSPRSMLEFEEDSLNSYPHCKTDYSNNYMRDGFTLSIETWHKADLGESENVYGIPADEWGTVGLQNIDIVNDVIAASDYREDQDPTKFMPQSDPTRGPLTSEWVDSLNANGNTKPYMCVYKLVKCEFQWFGMQNLVENMIQRTMQRVLTNFHRQMYCWMDNWKGLSLEDIRRLEDEAKNDLNALRNSGTIRGMCVG